MGDRLIISTWLIPLLRLGLADSRFRVWTLLATETSIRKFSRCLFNSLLGCNGTRSLLMLIFRSTLQRSQRNVLRAHFVGIVSTAGGVLISLPSSAWRKY